MHISKVVWNFIKENHPKFSTFVKDIPNFETKVKFDCGDDEDVSWEDLDDLHKMNDENFHELLDVLMDNCGPTHPHFKRFFEKHVRRIKPEKVIEIYENYFPEWYKFEYDVKLVVLNVMHKKLEESK